MLQERNAGWIGGRAALCCATTLVLGPLARSQAHGELWPRSTSHLIVPQAAGFALEFGREGVQIDLVRARVRIVEQVATTSLDVELSNPSSRTAEAVLLLPVPPGAAVHSFAFDGEGCEPSAEILPSSEARRIYGEIVSHLKDPALLEFASFDLVRSSLFPVPAYGKQHIRLSYEQVLERDGDRIDYFLPRSESLAERVCWQIEVAIESSSSIATVYSPSHALETLARNANHVVLRTSASMAADPGPFRLSFLLDHGEVNASLFTYPDPESSGGWFLLLAGVPPSKREVEHEVRREVTIVIDRSGSMAGEKMEQARAAATQILEGLEPGEALNVIDYSTEVASFAPRPVAKTDQSIADVRRYLAGLRAMGGTNLHDALLEALLPAPDAESLPIVLFLTDGLPTIGETSEVSIRDMVDQKNAYHRRVFTFGVGHDVNVPLLDRLAETTRASSTYVLPSEDVETKVAAVFQRLYGPVLADLELETYDETGALTTRAIADLHPGRLPDLYANDQLVVLGRYLEAGPMHFRLKGKTCGEPRSFSFAFAVEASTKNAFVPRLWATRRIAWLIDEIRQAGAFSSAQPGYAGANPPIDPRFREIVEEILALSTRFGILSEYTSFLAREGTDLSDWGALASACGSNLDQLAVRERAGAAAVNQGLNLGEQCRQTTLNYTNRMWQGACERVEIAGVQQMCDRAFFQQSGQWVDSQLVSRQAELVPDEIVPIDSPEHALLVERLAREGRAGLLALRGDVLLDIDGRRLLLQNHE
jgi:Ca-activated chloride channel family protein